MNYDSITSFMWCVVGVFAAVIALVFLFNVFESVLAAKLEEKEERRKRAELLDNIVNTITEQIKDSVNNNDKSDEEK